MSSLGTLADLPADYLEGLTARNLVKMEEEAPEVAAAFHRLMARQLAERLRNTDHMIRALTD